MPSYNIEIIRTAGRPTKYEEALKGWATDIVINLQNWMLAHDKIATGKSISSFKMLIADNEIILEGADSVAHALLGRKAGKMPPYKEGSDLETWVIAKPIVPYPDERGFIPTLAQITFLIARKIAREGTNPPKMVPQNINLIVTQSGQKYLDRIGEIQADIVREDFQKAFSRVGKPKN